MDDAEFESRMDTKNRGPRGTRVAISADASMKATDWEAPVHEKTPEQEARLEAALTGCFFFAALQRSDLAVVIKAFQETPVAAGTKVITEGDCVNATEQAIFVVEEGVLDVFKDGSDQAVWTYDKQGQYFGELAVLYDAPRAATVVAKTDSKLWSIDRNTFNFLVKDSARGSAERRVSFLKKVDIFE